MSQTDIAHRLRCKYPMGPIQENGEPEFGWRDFSGTIVEKMSLPSSVMLEAADYIDAQAAEIERLREALTNAEDRMRRVSRLLSEGHQFIDRGDTVRIWADDARAALSGEPT